MKENRYLMIKNKSQKRFDNFPMFFAFNDEQFNEGKEKLGVDNKDLLDIGYGGFIKKSDEKKLLDLVKSGKAAMRNEMIADKTGSEFCYDMWLYELDNHEYCITGEIEDAMEALNFLNDEDYEKYPQIYKGLEKAIKTINEREEI